MTIRLIRNNLRDKLTVVSTIFIAGSLPLIPIAAQAQSLLPSTWRTAQSAGTDCFGL
jgi:hypothetical protein